MKKLLLITGSVLLLNGLFAQQLGISEIPTNKNNPKATQHTKFDAQKFGANKGNKNSLRAGTEEYWLNYGISMDQYLGGGAGMTGPAELNSNYLFQDSLCFGEFGTGNFSSVWIHHVADVLDVKSSVFNAIDGVTWDATTPYRVDSLSINYAYTRNDPDPNVVDTLVVTLLTNSTTANLYSNGFIGATAGNYGTDTVSFKSLKYAFSTNSVSASGKLVFKIPLTEADTAIAFYREKVFEVPNHFNVAAGKLLGADIMFKPGYSYALGDQIDYDHNAFFFTSYEENGADTYPLYFDCNYQASSCDYNSSCIVPISVRYNQSSTGWNGIFIPSYAFGSSYAYEHHLISYKVVTPQTAAVRELANNNFGLTQNQPNPFTNETTINYQLKKSANNVNLQIFDVTGVKIYDKAETNVKAGNYSVNINNINFSAGMYFYSLVVDGEKVTKKMIAQ